MQDAIVIVVVGLVIGAFIEFRTEQHRKEELQSLSELVEEQKKWRYRSRLTTAQRIARNRTRQK